MLLWKSLQSFLTTVYVCASSSRESGNLWGNCRTPLLQQEQDRGEIPDCQMLLLPWTGGRNNKGSSVLRRRYAWLLITVLVMTWAWNVIQCKTVTPVTELLVLISVISLGMRGLLCERKTNKQTCLCWESFMNLLLCPKGFIISSIIRCQFLKLCQTWRSPQQTESWAI